MSNETRPPDTKPSVSTEFEYDAFISYRREDGSRPAQWLRRSVLSYELPESLRTPGKPLKVYLDTAYETATNDFFENNIRPALESSRHLIVVCTPSVAGKRADGEANWVHREIEAFSRLPQGRNVIPVNVTGQWNHVVPDRLRAEMPRVDIIELRRLAGWWGRLDLAGTAHDELLKVIAPLHGIEHHQMPILRQEEAKARQRRLRWIATFSLAVTLALTVLSLWAVLATHEARSNLVASLLSQARALSERRPGSARVILVEAIELAESDSPLSPDSSREAHIARTWLEQAMPPSPPIALWHSARVSWAEFDKTGARVVTASDDSTAQVWDARTGKRIGNPLHHNDSVTKASFDATGSLVATASWDGSARVWDAESGAPLTDELKHDDPVTAIGFSPDGKRLATCGWDDSVRVWEIETSRRVIGPIKTKFMCSDVAFSPNGDLLATGDWGGQAQLRDAADGLPLRRDSLVHDDIVNTIQFSPDGSVLLTASADGAARLWNVRSGLLRAGPFVHGHGVTRATLGPHGTLLGTSSLDGTARIWRPNGTCWASTVLPHHGAVNWIAFDPKLPRLATADNDGTARLWSTEFGQPLGAALEHKGPVNSVEFSPDGSRLLTSSDDGLARIWDLRYIAPVRWSFHDPAASGSPVGAAAIGGDGAWAVFGNNHRRLHIRSTATGEAMFPPIELDDVVSEIDIAPDKPWIVVASGSLARVIDTTTWTVLHELDHVDDSVEQALWSSNGDQVVSATLHGSVWVWRMSDLSRPNRLIHTDEAAEETTINDIAIDPTGELVASAGADGMAHLWRNAESEPVTSFELHESRVTSIAFHPTKAIVASADETGAVHLWDAAGTLLRSITGHRGSVEHVEFHPFEEILLTAGNDGTARMWSVETGTPVAKPMRHAHALWTAQFAPGGRLLATASQDRTVQLWETATGEPIGARVSHSATVSGLSFDASGEWLITEGFDGAAKLIRVAAASGETGVLRSSVERETLLRWDAHVQDTRLLTRSESSEPTY